MQDFPWDVLRDAASSIASSNDAKFVHVERFVGRVFKPDWKLAERESIDELFFTRVLLQLAPFSSVKTVSLDTLEKRPEWSDESKEVYSARVIGRMGKVFDDELRTKSLQLDGWLRCEKALDRVGQIITEAMSMQYQERYPVLHDLEWKLEALTVGSSFQAGLLVFYAIVNTLVSAQGTMTIVRPDELMQLLACCIPIGVTRDDACVILVH